jgi:hypothetical protein
MVGKNTRDSWHTESWRSSSFGPRNIGTGHKYSPSENNVKTGESAVSQDKNRMTTPEREYARQYEGNLDNLLDSWYEHPEDPTLLRYMYDTGMLKYDNFQIYEDPYINVWAKKKNIQSKEIDDKLTKSYYQLDPILTDINGQAAMSPSLLDRTDVSTQPFDAAHFWLSDQFKREYSANNAGQYAPIEGKETYVSEPLVKDAPAQSSTIHPSNPYGIHGNGRWSYPYTGAYNRNIKSIAPEHNNTMAQQWRDDPGEMYIPDSNPIWRDRFDFPKKPFNWRALIAGGAATAGLTGLGLLAAANSNNEQSEVRTSSQIEPEAQPESTLEQEYVTQNIPSFSSEVNNLFDLYQQQEQRVKDKAVYEAYLRAQEMGQRIASGTGYAPELKESNFVFPQNPPEVGSNIKTAGLESPDGGEVPQELNKLSGVKSKVIKDTSKGPVVLNDPNHRKVRNVQSNSITPEQAAATQMTNQLANIPVEVIRAKNSGYAQPPLNHATDAIWDRVRKAGLVSPEQGIRSGLFTPDEVRYITENDLWRYR